MDSTAGRLLVATPLIGDGNFERTVVLMIEHNDEGAVGVVLNRPSGLRVGDALPRWASHAAEPSTVFIGGPVANNALLALASTAAGETVEWWSPIVGGVGALDLREESDAMAAAVEQVRLFSGYSGWSSGQLEDEIGSGAWFVVDAEAADVMARNPRDLWASVLSRQSGTTAWFAHYPDEPRDN